MNIPRQMKKISVIFDEFCLVFPLKYMATSLVFLIYILCVAAAKFFEKRLIPPSRFCWRKI